MKSKIVIIEYVMLAAITTPVKPQAGIRSKSKIISKMNPTKDIPRLYLTSPIADNAFAVMTLKPQLIKHGIKSSLIRETTFIY